MLHLIKNKIVILIIVFLGLILSYRFYKIYQLSKLPKIIVENHTDKIMRVANYQFTSITEETTGEDEHYAKEIYRIDPSDTQTYELREENLIKNPNYLTISYYSTVDGTNYELVKESESEYIFKNSGHILFGSIPKNPNEHSYCSFKVDLYQNKKRIIKPLSVDNSCERKLYYYGVNEYR